jgi:hypothetical protein
MLSWCVQHHLNSAAIQKAQTNVAGAASSVHARPANVTSDSHQTASGWKPTINKPTPSTNRSDPTHPSSIVALRYRLVPSFGMRDRNDPLRRLLRDWARRLPSTMAFFFLGLLVSSHFYTIDVHGFSSTTTAADHSSRIVQRSAGRQHEQQYQTRISAASPSFFSLQSSLTDGSGGSSSTTAGTAAGATAADNDAETTSSSYTVLKADAATTDWELDCYSRPVVVAGTGKKLWEVLITDSAGSFRFRKSLPSNQVNSKTLRTVVDELIDVVDVKPSTIRFFRGAMFNMIQIALAELPVTSKPNVLPGHGRVQCEHGWG